MTRTIFHLFVLLIIAACSQEVPREKASVESEPKKDTQVVATDSLPKIVMWGPQETVAGINPNPQPDKGVGIWIRLSAKIDASEIQVFVDENKAITTAVDGELVTASLPMNFFMEEGKRKISIRAPGMLEVLTVGEFVIK